MTVVAKENAEKKNCLEKQNLRLSGGLVTDSNNTCTPLDERIRDIHHRHETVENPVRLLQLNGLWEQTFSATKQENTKIPVQAYCTPPESNLLSWLDNVFIGFQVLDSFFPFQALLISLNLTKNRLLLVLVKGWKEGLSNLGKHPVFTSVSPFIAYCCFCTFTYFPICF